MKNVILLLGLMLSLFATESEARCRRGQSCGGGRGFPILRMICGGRGQPACGGGRSCGPGMMCGNGGRSCGPGMSCGNGGQSCGPGRICGNGRQSCGPGRICGNGGHSGNLVNGGNGGNSGRVVDPVVVDPSFVATNERPPADISKDGLLPLLQDAGVPATVAKAIESGPAAGDQTTPVAGTVRTITSQEKYYEWLAKDKGFSRIVVAFTADDCTSCPQFKKDLAARFANRSDVAIYFINREKIAEPNGNSLVTLYQQKGYLNGNHAVPSGFVAFKQNEEWKINGGRVMEQFNFTNQLENELVRQVGGQR